MFKKTNHLVFSSVYAFFAVGLLLVTEYSLKISLVLAALPILYILFETKTFTNDSKVKFAQAFAYIGSVITLLFAWDLTLFLIAVVCGWILFGLGVSVCLHKWASHKTFVPKNNFWKTIILFFGTMCTLGSTISWAAGHREHHRFTDKDGDPHRPAGSLWHKIKVYFYYFPTYPISPMLIKDLTVDQGHKWFHKNYYKIIYAYALGLFLIDPIYAGYFYCLPVLYVFTGISWVTVIAHIPTTGRFGFRKDTYRIYPSDDYTYNSHIWQFLLMGEGYHNTHHSCPWLWNNAILPNEFDISAKIIQKIGQVNSTPPKVYNSVRRGQAMFDEIQAVAEKNKHDDSLTVPNPT